MVLPVSVSWTVASFFGTDLDLQPVFKSKIPLHHMT